MSATVSIVSSSLAPSTSSSSLISNSSAMVRSLSRMLCVRMSLPLLVLEPVPVLVPVPVPGDDSWVPGGNSGFLFLSSLLYIVHDILLQSTTQDFLYETLEPFSAGLCRLSFQASRGWQDLVVATTRNHLEICMIEQSKTMVYNKDYEQHEKEP